MTVDPTRLLVLGATRQEQPATGYAIMRELTGWGVQDWASINPGSIYGALRALVKDGLAVEGSEPGAKRGHKDSTKFRLTDAGQEQFSVLLREALREVDPYRPAPFMTALCFLVDLPRSEVIGLIEERLGRLEGQRERFGEDEVETRASASRPPHSVEFVQLAAGRSEGEMAFTRALLDRVRGGDYVFLGE